MSADLFAEFGHGASTNQPSEPGRQQVAASPPSLIPGLDAFEDATSSHSYSTHSTHYLPHSARLKASHNHSTQFDDFGDFERPANRDDNDVLFDATLEKFSDDGSDEWGEFESAEATAGESQTQRTIQARQAVDKPVFKVLQSPKPRSTSTGTLDLLDSLDSLSVKDAPRANHGNYSHTLTKRGSTIKSTQLQPKKPIPPVEDETFEDWGDFTDGPAETIRDTKRAVNKTEDATRASKALTQPRGTPPITKRVTQSTPNGHVRPTNIPPPSILLELFPRLFERLRQEGTEAKRNLQQREVLESVASSIISTLKAVARVVAGRTLRWKRDAILSQSMRIGPARSGKTGGMKLSTVNKNEDIKEKQEAVDVINMWRDRAAVFNSVIQAASKRPIQVMLENTRVITAAASQGAIKASHACALCGLKRDERIPKIDENVDDSFGEWWTEHWGHTECRQFWEDNMGLLGQR